MKLPFICVPLALVAAGTCVGCESAGSEGGVELGQVQSAVSGVGLLDESLFVDSIRTPEVAAALAASMSEGEWNPFPEGVARVIEENHPFSCASHATGFRVCAYHSNRGVELVRLFAPVVNGSAEENGLMMETMYAVAEALAPDEARIREWTDSAWQASWQAYGREGVTRADVVHERQIDGYLLSVWGVPPDFIQTVAILRR